MKAFKKIKVCDKLQEVSNLEKAMEVNPASATPAQEGLMWQPGNVKTHQMILLRNIINGKKNVLKNLISYLFITFVRIYYMGNFFLPEKYNLKLDSYQEFHEWSCENYDLFWSEVWDFCGVISSKKAEFVIDKKVPMNEIPKWFTGAKMNYAENLLRYRN